jgi:hypothetical protein
VLRLLGAALAAVIFLLAGLLVGSYTFLPLLVEGATARSLQDGLGLSEEPEVSLQSEPPPRILLGEFSGGRVELQEPTFAGVRPERFTLDLDPLEVDPLESLFAGELRTREPLSGGVRAELSEAELARIAGSRIEAFPVRGVELEEDRLLLRTGVEVLGAEVPVSVAGEPGVRDGSITFEPQDLSTFGVPLPGGVTDQLLGGTEFVYPMEELPFDGEITGLRALQGRVVLSGEAASLPLDG